MYMQNNVLIPAVPTACALGPPHPLQCIHCRKARLGGLPLRGDVAARAS